MGSMRPRGPRGLWANGAMGPLGHGLLGLWAYGLWGQGSWSLWPMGSWGPWADGPRRMGPMGHTGEPIGHRFMDHGSGIAIIFYND